MRGQAATEYLIIIAVVVIIALAVVGVLGGFPTITSGVSERDSAAYWASTDVGLARYKQNSTGTWGVLRNNKDFTVRVTRFGTTLSGSGVTLAPGQTTADFVQINSTLATCTPTSPGSTWSVAAGSLPIDYIDSTYNTQYNFTPAKSLTGRCTAS